MIHASESVTVPLPPAFHTGRRKEQAVIAGRRRGRLFFGAVLVVGAVVFAVSVLADGSPPGVNATTASTVMHLAGVWLVAAVAYLVGRISGAARQRDRGIAVDDEAFAWSLALPMMGLSLLLPLSIHALAHVALGVDHFAGWAAISVIVVGHAHLALAALCARAAFRVSRGEPRQSALAVLFIVAGVACVPGLVAFAIPPVLVFFTGALFVPWMLRAVDRTAERERREMGFGQSQNPL